MYKISFSLIFFLFIITSCEYENAGINAIERPVSYSGDIAPLLIRKCAVTGCHVAQATIGNFNVYPEIKLRIDNGKFQLMVFEHRLMPPATHPSLSELELTRMKKWIDGGALQN